MDTICVRKKKLFRLGIIFFALLCVSAVYALSNDVINNTESTISTSYVDIKIEEYRNGEEYTKEEEHVMPGEDISLNARVHNLGMDCYIRAKISYKIGNSEYNIEDYIQGDYKNWNLNGDYYYFDSVVNKDDSLSIFDTIHIPDNLNLDSSNQKIIVHTVVDAIQAKNFTGNWNNVVIEKSIERSYSIDSEGKSEIIYENNADKYISLENGFFDHLGGLVPGDSSSDKIIIQNSSNNRIRYYLSVSTNSLSKEELDLLSNIHILIKNGQGQAIKEGKLTDIDHLLLGTYNPKEGEEITLEISIPPDLDNEFSKIATKITWIFSVEEESDNPDTWDLKFDVSITLFLCSAAGLIIVMVLAKQEEDNIEKNKLEKRRKK